jgi:hypothetical protein
MHKKSFVVLQELEKGQVTKGQGLVEENPKKRGDEQRINAKQRLPESRFSERVYNQMLEKHGVVKHQGKKRTISGTNLNSQNSFVVLSFDAISSLAHDMGLDVSSMGYDTVDIMKDLKISRHALAKSKEIPIHDPNNDVPLEEVAPSADVPLLEWLENDSDAKQFTLV